MLGKYKNPNYMVEYRIKNRERLLAKGTAYRIKNRERIRAYVKEHMPQLCRALQQRNIELWKRYIPAQTTCQCCGKIIIFNSGNHKTSIHFDHRHNGVELIKLPMNWLKSHKPTQEYLKIWLSCDFGMLCRECNTFLPTLNRAKFIEQIVNYVRGQNG
jgi:hypothetical protein